MRPALHNVRLPLFLREFRRPSRVDSGERNARPPEIAGVVSRHVVVRGDEHGIGVVAADRLKKLGILQSPVTELGRAYGAPSPASKFCPQAGLSASSMMRSRATGPDQAACSYCVTTSYQRTASSISGRVRS